MCFVQPRFIFLFWLVTTQVKLHFATERPFTAFSPRNHPVQMWAILKVTSTAIPCMMLLWHLFGKYMLFFYKTQVHLRELTIFLMYRKRCVHLIQETRIQTKICKNYTCAPSSVLMEPEQCGISDNENLCIITSHAPNHQKLPPPEKMPTLGIWNSCLHIILLADCWWKSIAGMYKTL